MNKTTLLNRIYSIQTVCAAKDHVCDFSGDLIKKGANYTCVKYCYQSETPNRTWHVSEGSTVEFIKSNLYLDDSSERKTMLTRLRTIVQDIADRINSFNSDYETSLTVEDVMSTIKRS